jgi:hypothetical protein
MWAGACIISPEVENASEINEENALVPRNYFVQVFLAGP